ncbi:integrase [Dactylosporangium salmoneum]|uniref:Core-binding (CB) domain-containing protein n=1 Tax=Dactylosporangium salmoneum TaxID=53361 RepID=A0ABN3GYC6_9ACTN
MAADPAKLAAAWAYLAELGVTLADLQHDARPALPTFDDYLPQVLAAAGPGALRAYRSYWQRMTRAWGNQAIDTVTASDLQAMRQHVTNSAQARRNSRGGRHAGELFIAAARAFYNRAIADGLIQPTDSPPGRQTTTTAEHPKSPHARRTDRD